jgi:hypothetical protein
LGAGSSKEMHVKGSFDRVARRLVMRESPDSAWEERNVVIGYRVLLSMSCVTDG